MYNYNGLSRLGVASVSILLAIIGFIAVALFTGKILDMGKTNVNQAKTQSEDFISKSNTKISDLIDTSAQE